MIPVGLNEFIVSFLNVIKISLSFGILLFFIYMHQLIASAVQKLHGPREAGDSIQDKRLQG